MGGDADVALNERLNGSRPTTSARRLAGYEEATGVAAKVFSDIDHLIVHVKSRADAFVTFDQGTILSRRSALPGRDILACTPPRLAR